MSQTETLLAILAFVLHILIQHSEQCFLNGIKSGLDEDLKHSLFLSHIGQCRWQRGLPILLSDMRMVQQSNTQFVVSGVLLVRRNFTKPLQTKVQISICRNETICSPFVDPPVDVGDACEFMRNQKNDTISSFLANSIPELKCPLLKGLYRVNDVLVDYKPFRFFSPHVSKFWRINFIGKSEQRQVFCLTIEIYVYSWEDMLPN